MTAILNLTIASALRFEGVDDIIALPESLDLKIVSDFYDTREIVLDVRNGSVSERRKVKGGESIDLSTFLFAGKIEMTVNMIAKGHVVKKWNVVPLILKEAEGEIHVFDQINELANRVAALEEKTKIVL